MKHALDRLWLLISSQLQTTVVFPPAGWRAPSRLQTWLQETDTARTAHATGCSSTGGRARSLAYAGHRSRARGGAWLVAQQLAASPRRSVSFCRRVASIIPARTYGWTRSRGPPGPHACIFLLSRCLHRTYAYVTRGSPARRHAGIVRIAACSASRNNVEFGCKKKKKKKRRRGLCRCV